MESYIELQTTTNFSFLTGASHPSEFVQQTKLLGYRTIGITDRNTLAGVVRAQLAAKQEGIRLLVGTRLDFTDDTPSLLCYPKNRHAYGQLSRLLTEGKRRAQKGECLLYLDDLDFNEHILIVVPPDSISLEFALKLNQLRTRFRKNLYLAAQFLFGNQSAKRLHQLNALSKEHGIPLVATNDVHAHVPERRVLQDVLTCIRSLCNIHEAGFRLHANAERYLKPIDEMHRLFARYPHALKNTVKIAQSISFNLDELRYEYPDTQVPAQKTPQQYLAMLTFEGAQQRYPEGVPQKVQDLLEYELKLIAQLNYAPYFLTVHDIVQFARSRSILCQGRGSAANSAVCYCLGITAVDPTKLDLLFERFISPERNEPPDIDVDFEHERREEVIQYIYERYGRDKAGIAATVITYRKRSALRDVGKALGVPLDVIEDLIVALKGYKLGDPEIPLNPPFSKGEIGEIGKIKNLRLLLELAGELLKFPRHLSQHVGGFVITKGPLCELVPIGNAAMEDRTFIEWDKDDLDAMGMLKIDVLALGMLSCIRRCFDLIGKHYHRPLSLATVPAEDSAVYDMLSRADSIGVFQVESRAQMSMLPRLRPRCFYDLVIEVAIVRPGPIQGDMVHPYLRRRNGEEQVEYPSQALKEVLGKTLGVPLFQEQAMRIAVVAAGFTPSEADQLRRAMATFRHSGVIHQFRDKFINGMLQNGYEQEFAERCFNQILGFGEYGFPESHAASFALLVYVSSWLKAHYPAAFACALLNSQPMGFYAPAQLIDDARRHGVKVLPIDVNYSDWENTLEKGSINPMEGFSLRLGLNNIRGIHRSDAEWVVACRGPGYKTPLQLAQRTGIGKSTLERLSTADAFASMNLNRRESLWSVRGIDTQPLPLFECNVESEEPVLLPNMSEFEQVTQDYHTLSFTLRRHPVSFLRERLKRMGYVQNIEIKNISSKTKVKIAGLVIVRQRPGTAKGVVFQTIEDETGFANIVIWPHIFEKYREETLAAPFIGMEGIVEKQGEVIHVIANKLIDLSRFLENIETRSRDFH